MLGAGGIFASIEPDSAVEPWRRVHPAARMAEGASEAIVFKLLGVLVALYVAYALSIGEVYAKRGIWGAASTRAEQPVLYWSAMVVYAILALALLFVF